MDSEELEYWITSLVTRVVYNHVCRFCVIKINVYYSATVHQKSKIIANNCTSESKN